MGLTKRQELLVEVLKRKPGEWVNVVELATAVNDLLFEDGCIYWNEIYHIHHYDKRNPCPMLGADQREINADMDNDYIIITSKHSFMIMPTKSEVEREISRYYKIALAKLKRAREFVKKVNLNGQYNILEGDYRQTILDEIYKD